jgi:L-glyceraldehyde 3-phosphate reductase
MAYLPDPERYQSMEYRRCGRSGLKLPAISLGLWHNFGHVDVLENCRRILRLAFDRGITHFDLANNYGPPAGSAEENFGRLLREDFRGYRDQLIISTKAGYYMWKAPTANGAPKNTWCPAWTKACNAWAWNTSISFITTVPIPIRHSKRRWPRWTWWCARARHFT